MEWFGLKEILKVMWFHPPAMRRHLALGSVCKSAHKPDLDKTTECCTVLGTCKKSVKFIKRYHYNKGTVLFSPFI